MLLAIENTSIRIEQFPPVHNFHKSQLDQCDRTDPPYQCNIIELSVCEGTPFPTVTQPTPRPHTHTHAAAAIESDPILSDTHHENVTPRNWPNNTQSAARIKNTIHARARARRPNPNAGGAGTHDTSYPFIFLLNMWAALAPDIYDDCNHIYLW